MLKVVGPGAQSSWRRAPYIVTKARTWQRGTPVESISLGGTWQLCGRAGLGFLQLQVGRTCSAAAADPRLQVHLVRREHPRPVPRPARRAKLPWRSVPQTRVPACAHAPRARPRAWVVPVQPQQHPALPVRRHPAPRRLQACQRRRLACPWRAEQRRRSPVAHRSRRPVAEQLPARRTAARSEAGR